MISERAESRVALLAGLTRGGYQVATAGTLSEAIAQGRRWRPCAMVLALSPVAAAKVRDAVLADAAVASIPLIVLSETPTVDATFTALLALRVVG